MNGWRREEAGTYTERSCHNTECGSSRCTRAPVPSKLRARLVPHPFPTVTAAAIQTLACPQVRLSSPLLPGIHTHTHTSPLFPSPPSPFSRCHGCSLWSSVDVHHSTPEAPLLFHSTSQSMRACMHVGGWVSMPVCGRVCLVALAVAVARTRESWRALLSIRAQIHRHRHRHARARACAYTVMYNS